METTQIFTIFITKKKFSFLFIKIIFNLLTLDVIVDTRPHLNKRQITDQCEVAYYIIQTPLVTVQKNSIFWRNV